MEIISPQLPIPTTGKYQQMIKTYPDPNEYENLNQQERQQQINFDQEDVDNMHYQPSLFLKLFFIYLYFSQGLVIALSATMPYIYPQLPTYDVMAIFNASTLPYSFKFIIAPIIQKYTNFGYGKRKFWIIISQTLASISIIAASFFTQSHNNYQMAILLCLTNFFMTFQDISLDSLAKKQLRHAHVVSMISSTSQMTGIIFGSMLLLKLTSLQFAHILSLQKPITTINLLIMIMGILIFVPSIFIHFLFKQTMLKRQYQAVKLPIGEVFCTYKAFFVTKGKYFRTILLFIFFNQGFNFFTAGYDYQLIKAGFSRNTNNTISNIVAIPIAIIACFMASRIQPFGIKKGIAVSTIGQSLIFIYLRVFFPMNVYSIAITSFLAGILDQWKFLIVSIMIYQFPLHPFTGMFITFLASSSNLGNSTAIHTKILARSNWWLMSWIGICLQLIILAFVYFFYLDWKDQGKIDIQQIFQQQQQIQNQNPKKKNQIKQLP